MKNKLRKPLCICLVFIALTAAFTFSANAADDATRYQNSETGYRAVIIDELDLLTDSEESQLALDMAPITAYGNIAFWTTMEPTSNEIDSARLKRKELFGFSSAGIFAVNMSVKKLTIQSYGDINSVITDSYARSITDNVKNYASTGDYYTCAQMAFQQIYTKLDGTVSFAREGKGKRARGHEYRLCGKDHDLPSAAPRIHSERKLRRIKLLKLFKRIELLKLFERIKLLKLFELRRRRLRQRRKLLVLSYGRVSLRGLLHAAVAYHPPLQSALRPLLSG